MELAESDLATTLEGDFGLPVIIKGGGVADQTVNGQVLRSYFTASPETGEPMIENDPVVTLRISSLSTVPQAGETWYFMIPGTPSPTAATISFLLDTSKAPEFNHSMGFVKYRLTAVTQS